MHSIASFYTTDSILYSYLLIPLYIHRTNKALIKITKPLHDLRVLSVDQCEMIGDDFIEALVVQCPYIQELYLGSTHITDSSVNLLATKFILLTHLHMPGCELITEVGIKTLIRECKTLKYFDIKDCFNVVGDFDSNNVNSANEDFRFINANHRAFGDTTTSVRLIQVDNDDDDWEDVDEEDEEQEYGLNEEDEPAASMEYQV
jgi:hypothetical protein